ncbi:MAG TPA: hypothetical protein DDY19_09685 [Alteromonas macleodii]|nr:hypothetical protein [Alteromonas macleodii]|tara:strand:- start:601 stop:1110 length:510 start_codon:yes stop_codon:yes gene_type:complete
MDINEAQRVTGANNHQLALASYLKVDDCDLIEPNGVHGRNGNQVHCFRHKGTIYSVAHDSVPLQEDVLISFERDSWRIRKVNPKAPYVRFTDKAVLNQLATICPMDHQLLKVNQQCHRVLMAHKSGLQVVFAYTAHIPDDIETYYFKGATVEGLQDMARIFDLDLTTSQ